MFIKHPAREQKLTRKRRAELRREIQATDTGEPTAVQGIREPGATVPPASVTNPSHKPKYTPEIAEEIAERISKGETVSAILRSDARFPSRTVFHEWQAKDPAYTVRIARAREDGHDAIADDIVAIADSSERDTIEKENGPAVNAEWIARSRLRCEMRLKLLSKWDPRRYGERLAVDQSITTPGKFVLDFTIEGRGAGLPEDAG